MRLRSIPPVAIAAGFAALFLAAAPAKPAAAVRVSIADYAFKPAVVTIVAGTPVIWTNQDDDPHTVTADDGSFDSKGLGQGDTYRRAFVKPGRYPYHCAVHPFMKGTIVVTAGAVR
ncbi:MAG TPA: cupredoxin family copper-binding protein [Candidatus Eremiobacteraceae bacterium]|nr:cupredoxin family copper-binding protein [Candidatus Eremiobacteraceae bacterium]